MLSKKCLNPEISYSIFVKTRKPVAIWQFHRFSEDILDALYPVLPERQSDVFSKSSDFESSSIILTETSKESTLRDNDGETPVDHLK